jgi:hypothetical protein
MDTIEEDFRDWLAADDTPVTGIAALVGLNVYFTAIPTKLDGAFIGTKWPQNDRMHTTNKTGGPVLAKCEVKCCFKGADPVLDYSKAKALAQAVKARVNSADGTWLMGNTKIFSLSIDDRVEGEGGEGTKDKDFLFHAGQSSGIQEVIVPVAFHYWGTNN